MGGDFASCGKANLSFDGTRPLKEKEIAMSDDVSPEQPAESVRVELELPSGLYQDYDRLVADGIYSDIKVAFVHAIVESWRHNKGSFHTIRLDVVPRQKADKTEPEAAEPKEAAGD